MKPRLLRFGKPEKPVVNETKLWDTENDRYVLCHNSIPEMCDSACGAFSIVPIVRKGELGRFSEALCRSVRQGDGTPLTLGDMAPKEPATASIPEAPTFPQPYHVDGNKIVGKDGKPAVLRGLTPLDILGLERKGELNQKLFRDMKAWEGTTVIRLVISPPEWRKLDPEGALDIIAKCFEWCNRLGMYIIINWHGIGWVPLEHYPHEWAATSKDETRAFWRLVSQRFAGCKTVFAYELFNEPISAGSGEPEIVKEYLQLLTELRIEEPYELDWENHADFMEEIIKIIREHDPDTPVMVGTLDYCTSAIGILKRPIKDDNVIYTVHLYPAFFESPGWRETWEAVADKFTVYVSEVGYGLQSFVKIREHRLLLEEYVPGFKELYERAIESDDPKIQAELWNEATQLIEANETAMRYLSNLEAKYGAKLKALLNNRGIGFCAWLFYDGFGTPLIKEDGAPTRSGEFFKGLLAETLNPKSKEK